MRTKTPIRIVERLTAAHKEMSDAVSRQWHRETALKISIPARPSHDSDMIVCGAIREAESVIEGLYEALEAVIRLIPHHQDSVKGCIECAMITEAKAALAKARGEGQ